MAKEFGHSFQTGKMSLCGEGSSSNKTKLVTIHFEASLEGGKKKEEITNVIKHKKVKLSSKQKVSFCLKF